MINIEIQQSELEAAVSNYSGDQMWEEALQQSLKGGNLNAEEFIKLFSNYVSFNDELGGGIVILAGAISKRKDLFNYNPAKPNTLNDIPYLIGQHIISEAIVEYGDRTQNDTSRLRTHREEAIGTLLAIAEFFGYENKSEQFYKSIQTYSSTSRVIIELDNCYQIDRKSSSSRVGESLGLNFCSEYKAMAEFTILSRFLENYAKAMVSHLTGRDMYYYVKAHGGESGLESEHTASAKKSIDYALNHFTGDKMEFKNDIIRGVAKFSEIQERFMKGLLK